MRTSGAMAVGLMALILPLQARAEDKGPRDPVMGVIGAVVSGVGGSALVNGALMFAFPPEVQMDTQCMTAPCSQPAPIKDGVVQLGGIIMMVSGATMMAVGAQLTAVGFDAADEERVQLSVGPGSVEISGSF